MDLNSLTNLELLRIHTAVIEELKQRDVVRTANNPVGDYAEWLVSTELGLLLTRNSQAGYDATDSDGARYQIKGRRVPYSQGSATLSAIRNLARGEFDWLIALIFKPDFSLRYAAKIPSNVVSEVATFRAHTNGHVLNLHPSILERQDVYDLTTTLSASRCT